MVGTPAPVPGPSPVVDTLPTNTPDQFSFKNATFDEVLEELSSRFILNLPEDELAEVERVCFQVEQAHWYYEDFIREEKPSFPSLPLKKFSEILFHSCPLLHRWSHDHETAFNGFMNYKTRVPVCGAIMLNEALTKCILVKGWKSSAGWGFPKGKVNENEDEAFCAVREVLEETGYNLSGKIRRTDCIRLCIKQQPITLFVVPGVPEDFPFKTQTRKEISKIDWFKLAELPTWKKNLLNPNKFYLITPVISPLKIIVRNLRKTRKATRSQLNVMRNVSTSDTDDHSIVDDAVANPAVESPETLEPSSRSQSGEAEASSSQSSSIDPHTPSVNGDLAPHTSDDTLVVKHEFSTDAQDIVLDTEMGISMGALSSNVIGDPRGHWSRLMTRLNHSEESSPRRTPQTLTPTPPVIPDTAKSEHQLLYGSSQSHLQITNGGPSPGHLSPEGPSAKFSPRSLKRHSNVVTRSSSVSSFLFQPEASRFSAQEARLGLARPSAIHPLPSSPDPMMKRTKQLQLLDSVLAEESARETFQAPKSAHTLGSYPHSAGGPLQGYVRSPVRPASANLDEPSMLSAPVQFQAKSSASVLPTLVPASIQHRSCRPPKDRLPQPPRADVDVERPLTRFPSQSHLASYTTTTDVVDAIHRGHMLSILSGGTSTLRPTSSSQVGVNPGSTLRDSGTASGPLSIRNFSSTFPVGSTPRSANAHLLSILNKPSPAGRVSPLSMSLQTRQ